MSVEKCHVGICFVVLQIQNGFFFQSKLTLLHVTFLLLQGLVPFQGINFELGAATVDPQSPGYDPKPLVHYLASLGVPYFFEEQGNFTSNLDLFKL